MIKQVYAEVIPTCRTLFEMSRSMDKAKNLYCTVQLSCCKTVQAASLFFYTSMQILWETEPSICPHSGRPKVCMWKAFAESS